jgi:hypothetical protein
MRLFINNISVDKKDISIADVGKIQPSWDADMNDWYTLIMYSYASDKLLKINMLISDIQGNMIKSGTLAKKIFFPKTAKKVVLALYIQQGPLKYKPQEATFSLKTFILKNRLKLVDKVVILESGVRKTPAKTRVYRKTPRKTSPSKASPRKSPSKINSRLSSRPTDDIRLTNDKYNYVEKARMNKIMNENNKDYDHTEYNKEYNKDYNKEYNKDEYAHEEMMSKGLTDQQEKYCRCVVHVAEKQPAACNEDKAWYEKRDGEECYNPYAVCAKTTGTTSRDCGEHYEYRTMTKNELVGIASLKGIKGAKSMSKANLVNALEGKRREYKKTSPRKTPAKSPRKTPAKAVKKPARKTPIKRT